MVVAILAILIVLGVLLACLIWPLGTGVDYMNHLARVHIERELSSSELLQRFYDIAPGNIPDLVMDIFIGYLFPGPDIYLAGAVMVFLAAVTLPLAGLLLAFRIHGRIGINHLLVFVVAFSFCLRMGFVNFQIALGLALFGYIAWIYLKDSLVKLFAFALFAVMLYFFHVLGLLIFGFLVLVAELGETWQRSKLDARSLAILFLRLGIVFVAPVVLLVMTLSIDHGVVKEMSAFGSMMQRIRAFSSAFGYGYTLLSFCLLFVVYVYLREFANFSALNRRDKSVLIALAVLVALMPWQFLGISYLEVRYAPLLFVMIFAMASPCPVGKRKFHAAFAVLMIFIGFSAYLTVLARVDTAQSELRQALRALPDGSTLLTGMADDFFAQSGASDYVHSNGIHVIENNGFVTSLFTNTSPVKVRPAYQHLQLPQGFPLPDSALLDSYLLEYTRYRDWRSDFDYLLWMRSRPEQYSSLSGLELIDEKVGFVIYKIVAME